MRLGRLTRFRNRFGSRRSYTTPAPTVGGYVSPTGVVSAISDTPSFWVIDRSPWKFTPEVCQMMIEAVLEAISKALVSGVVEYRVGSRSLRRFTLRELQDLLGFWTRQLEDSLMGGSARRGAPTDT